MVRAHACNLQVGVEAGYEGAHTTATGWPQITTVPLTVPNASACASGDVELRANILVGVGGEAKFQLEQESSPLVGFSFNESLSVVGNWIDALVGFGKQGCKFCVNAQESSSGAVWGKRTAQRMPPERVAYAYASAAPRC